MSEVPSGGSAVGAIAHHQHRGAALARYAHPAATTLLALVALGLFFGTHGAVRRAYWEWFGPLLGANGIAAFFGFPALLALTWWWKRGPPRPFERIDLEEDPGDIVVRVMAGTFHRIPRQSIAAVDVEDAPDGMRRIGLTVRGRALQDRYLLVLPPDLAQRTLAFIGPRPTIFDPGPRRIESAAWSFLLSYLATFAGAALGSALVRRHVPLDVFEPWTASESLGWAMGLGAAAFGPAFAALSLWARPPELRLGVDGLWIARRRGVRSLPWSEMAGVSAEGRHLEIVRSDGTLERVVLRGLPERRMVELVRVLRGRIAAAREAAQASTSEPVDGAPDGAAYRNPAVDEGRLEAELVAPGASSDRRLRAARILAVEGERGRALVRVAALGIADPVTRSHLENLSEAEAVEAEEGRVRPARRARSRG